MKKEINYLLLYFILGIVFIGMAQSNFNSQVIGAHAHNDYLQKQPLFDALKYNFKSIEVDVFSIGDSLFVAHDYDKIEPGFTLRNLYLDPLTEVIEKNKGSVYGDDSQVILLVDIKDDGLKTYRVLHRILESYQDIISLHLQGKNHHGSIQVIVSGNRPLDFMKNQKTRHAAYDGRISDLESGLPSSLMPLISDNWNRHFKWKGKGKMPYEEKEKLKLLVDQAHKKGSLLRFWSTPEHHEIERIAVWRVLQDAGVDLIGTDDLEGLFNFLNYQK